MRGALYLIPLLLLGCRPDADDGMATSLPAEVTFSEMDHAAFRAILDDFNASWQTLDADRFVRHFADDGDFMQAFGRYRSNRDSTQAFMAFFFGLQEGGIVSREVATRVKPITPDVAFLEQTLEAEGVEQRDGQQQPPRRGQMMLVLHRQPEGWHIRSYRYLDLHTRPLTGDYDTDPVPDFPEYEDVGN
ncbi:MAG: SgcJ/EcaC family oxidoreductase [Bacteroidota bacterium]